MRPAVRGIRSEVLAGVALVSTIAASALAIMHYEHDQEASFRRQIGQQVRQDGFDGASASDGSLGSDNIIHIGELSLGFCELSDVSAKVEMNSNNSVADIEGYSFKQRGSDVTLHFDNITQAETELPVPMNGNC